MLEELGFRMGSFVNLPDGAVGYTLGFLSFDWAATDETEFLYHGE
jgi:hypothetical protein